MSTQHIIFSKCFQMNNFRCILKHYNHRVRTLEIYIKELNFTNKSHFNADLCPINDNGLFEKTFHRNPSWRTGIEESKIIEHFSSWIFHMLFFNSNIPLNIFYSFSHSKITRLLRNTGDYLKFVILDNKLFWQKRELKEGYQKIIN